MNRPKSAWMAFALHVPIVIPCLLESVVTYFKVYCLKEHEAVFLKKQNLILSRVAGSIWFVFWFQTTYFYKQDLKFPVIFGGQKGHSVNWAINPLPHFLVKPLLILQTVQVPLF